MRKISTPRKFNKKILTAAAMRKTCKIWQGCANFSTNQLSITIRNSKGYHYASLASSGQIDARDVTEYFKFPLRASMSS